MRDDNENRAGLLVVQLARVGAVFRLSSEARLLLALLPDLVSGAECVFQWGDLHEASGLGPLRLRRRLRALEGAGWFRIIEEYRDGPSLILDLPVAPVPVGGS